jgi:oxygen-independent coproporphyrinogen-3 oxidase
VVSPIHRKQLQELIQKYQVNGPRYTSYPSALKFDESFSDQDYYAQVKSSNQFVVPKPLSVYIHIPFCASLCYYCGCNKVVSRKKGIANEYLESLYKEIELQAVLYEDDRLLEQIHFGGGTPTYLTSEQLEELLGVLAQHFHLALPNKLELGIEVDPRSVNDDTIAEIIALGFNRISIGVQDFDPEVQVAINRVQSRVQVISVVEAARRNGVKSVSLDLIYGLPKQTKQSFKRTIDEVVAIRPARIALYHYAHMPNKINSQRLIDESTLPPSSEKIEMFSETIGRLIDAGYIYIGMDHFALADDSLAQALTNGGLQRNFQGYSTHAECDIIGLGVSAISNVNQSFCQNTKSITTYKEMLAKQKLPIEKGISLNEDDQIRAEVIQRLMCDGIVDYNKIGRQYNIHFQYYFDDELLSLEPLAKDDLIQLSQTGFSVTERGRFFLRNIAMVFDVYLPKVSLQAVSQSSYSKTL